MARLGGGTVPRILRLIQYEGLQEYCSWPKEDDLNKQQESSSKATRMRAKQKGSGANKTDRISFFSFKNVGTTDTTLYLGRPRGRFLIPCPVSCPATCCSMLQETSY